MLVLITLHTMQGSEIETESPVRTPLRCRRRIQKEKARGEKFRTRLNTTRRSLRRTLERARTHQKTVTDGTVEHAAVLRAVEDRLLDTEHQLFHVQSKYNRLEENHSHVLQEKHRLEVLASRVPDRIQRAVESARREQTTYLVKDKGVVTDDARSLVRDLVQQGIPRQHVLPAIRTVASHMRVNLDGDFSARTISRIIFEGSIASIDKVVEEMVSADRTRFEHFPRLS